MVFVEIKYKIKGITNYLKQFLRFKKESKIYKKRKEKSLKHLKSIGKNTISINIDDVLLFGIMRNEAQRLPHFIKYYKKLGVDRFFIIDNNSDDNSIDLLKKEKDVQLFSTTENYFNHWYWMEYLLDTYGKNHWCVVVDIDELFSFPNSDSLSLKGLSTFLEFEKSTALCSFLLDMYSNNTIEKINYKAGNNPLNDISYFDRNYEITNFSFIDTLQFKAFTAKIFIGGMRKRVFGEITPPHILSKVSFFKNIEGTYLVQGMHAINGAKMSNLQGVVFHTKFLSDFIKEVKEETKRGEHYGSAFYYKHYERKIRDNPNLNLYCEDSIEYKDNDQLINLGLMKTSERFESFCQSIQ